ncbi:MAG: LON peptidase substrate-binding domain-containing protein [Pseudomonadota bacterium]
MSEPLPIFALGTVLFPHGALALKVFEPRYVDMVSRCMRTGSPFGVACIRHGSEVGDAANVHNVGTLAHITDFDQLDNGLLGITATGGERFRIVATEVLPDQLLVATSTEPLAVDPPLALPGSLSHLATVALEIRKVASENGYGDRVPADTRDDAGWIANRIAEVLPVSLSTKQRLLEILDPLERLDAVNEVVMKLADRD